MAWCFFSQVSKALAVLNRVGEASGRMADLAAGIAWSVPQESRRAATCHEHR